MKTWLATGDEAGNWDRISSGNTTDKCWLGVALTLAPLDAWQHLDKERIGDKTAQERMANPLFSLPEDFRISKHHHIQDVLKYGIKGDWSLSEQTDDPVKAELRTNFRWFMHHSRLFTLGAYAQSAVINQQLHYAADAAQALGQIYGYLAALVFPFLGPEDHLLISPGLRSENLIGNIAQARTRMPNRDNPQSTNRIHGDSRGMFSACQQTALDRLAAWPDADAQRRLDVGTLHHLSQHHGINLPPYNALNGVADLGASLLSMCHFPDYAIRLNPAELPSGNFRFLPLGDLLEELR